MACQWQHSVMGLILVFCILPALVQAESIIEPPANFTGLSDGTAKFVCQIDFGLAPRTMKWKFNNKVVYSYLSGLEEFPFADTKKYSIKRSREKFTLTVEKLNIKDGGKYTCTAFERQATANLIVVGKPVLIPPVSTPVEGNIVQYKCEANFGGPHTIEIAPENHLFLRLFIYDNVLDSSYYNETLYSGNIHKVQKVASIQVNASMNGKQLTCEVRTTSHEANATDNFTLEVQYPVRNTRYSPKNNRYEAGSQISCSADGKPTPTFEWRNVADPGRPIKSRLLNITEVMTGQNEWFCIASNNIGGEVFKEVVNATFEIIHDSTAGVPSAHSYDGNVFIVSGLFIVLICLFGIIGYLYWKGNRRMYHLTGQVNPDMDNDYYEKSLEMMELATIQQNLLLPDTQQEIMELLGKDEEEKFQFNSQVFLTAIREASKLISTEHYLEIVMKMSENWQGLEKKPDEEPLQCLLQLLNDEEEFNNLFNHQEKILKLIKILTETSCKLSMSKCLGFLISNAEYISASNCTIQWTDELISTIKLLLEKEADPTWIPNANSPELKRSDTYSAQYNIFGVIKKIIVNKNHIIRALMDILQLYFYKCNKPEQVSDTILHALVEPDWVLFEDLQKEPFIQQYLEIISEVNEYNPDLVDMTDWNGDTPLQLFIKGINIHENALRHVERIVQLLKPNSMMLMQNHQHQTLYHYLAEAFPVFMEPPRNNGIITLLRLMTTDFKLYTSLKVQDKCNKCTALHVLVDKYKRDQSGFEHMFLELVKKFTGNSNTNVKNKEGLTALHMLVDKCPHDASSSEMEQYLMALSYLAAKSDIKLQNEKGQTALHILTESYKTDSALGARYILKFFEIPAFKFVNVQDNQGYTVLHVIANKYSEEVDECSQDTYLKVVKHFCLNCSTSIQDRCGQTPLHIIAKKYSKNSPTHCQEMLLELLRSIATESNIDVQDNQGQTALHILASKYREEVSQYGLNAFLQALKHLIQMSNVTIQDHEGLTVFHIFAESFKKDIPEHCQKLLGTIQLLRSKLYTSAKDSDKTSSMTDVLLSKNPLGTFLEVMGLKGSTHLKTIAEKYNSIVPEDYRDMFYELVKQFDTASNLDIQDKRGRTALHIFANKFPKEISYSCSQTFLEIMKDQVSHFSSVAKDVEGSTALHIIAKNYCKSIPEHCQKIFIDLLDILSSKKKSFDQDASLDDTAKECMTGSQENQTKALLNHIRTVVSKSSFSIQDSKGRTILHILAEKLPTYVRKDNMSEFFKVMENLGSFGNTDIQDNEGQSVLHIAIKNYDKVTHGPHKKSFFDLIDIFKPAVDIRDNSGQTALHILLRKIYFYPDLGKDLVPVVSCISTPKNVNAEDKHQVTPYRWFQRGKLENQKDLGTGEVFSEIEKILFPKYYGHLDGARSCWSSDFVKAIQEIHCSDDLVSNAKKIQDCLTCDGQIILEENPRMFTVLIQKANDLLTSPHYIQIMRRMGEFYNSSLYEPNEGPLHCMLQKMNDPKERNKLLEHQMKMLQLIKILIKADNCSKSRNECLLFLMSNTEFITTLTNVFEWNELIGLIQLLMKLESDPTFIPHAHLQDLDRRNIYTAQYRFFGVLIKLFVDKEIICKRLMDFLPMFLSPKCPNSEQVRGTILHALVEPDWNWFNENLRTMSFFEPYCKLLSEVIEDDPVVINMTDWNGDTPLQSFMQGIRMGPRMLSFFTPIVSLLGSSINVCTKNNQQQTVLHYIADAFPIFAAPPNRQSADLFVKIVKRFSRDENVCIQDNMGRTVLHILAERYNSKVAENFRYNDLFDGLVRISKIASTIDVQDNQKQTALHILATNWSQIVSPPGFDNFLNTMKYLVSQSKTIIKDQLGRTVRDILLERNNPVTEEYSQNKYLDLLDKLSN